MTPKVEATFLDMRINGGNTRRFAIRRALSMRAANLLADKQEQIVVLRDLYDGKPDLKAKIVQLFFPDAARTQDAMQAILVGDHDGIAWYDDGDPQQMEDALLDFLKGIHANYASDVENPV